MKRTSTILMTFGTLCAAALFIIGLLAGFGITVPDPTALVITLLMAALVTIIPGVIIKVELP